MLARVLPVLLVLCGMAAPSLQARFYSLPAKPGGEVNLQYVRGGADPYFLKMHAIFGTLGWLVFASLAIMFARYTRDCWPSSKICKTRLWFFIHQFCLYVTVTLTILAVIFAFLFTGGYSYLEDSPTLARLHPPLGLSVLILGITNPILALTRNKWKRSIFNWVHWGVGTLAHVMGVFVIYLGLLIPLASWIVKDWMKYLLAGHIAFHIFTECVLQFHYCLKERRKDSEEMSELQPKEEGEWESPKVKGQRFRGWVVVIYSIVTLVVGLAFAMGIAIGQV